MAQDPTEIGRKERNMIKTLIHWNLYAYWTEPRNPRNGASLTANAVQRRRLRLSRSCHSDSWRALNLRGHRF